MRVLNFPSSYKSGETPYSIFKDRMTAVSSIATGIKNIIANKFINKQQAMIAENIQNEIDEQQATDIVELILSDPSDEIYPTDPSVEEIVGQFVKKYAMGPMRQRETMMGNLPDTTITEPTAESTIPKTDLYRLYNAIKDLPTGQMSWEGIYKKMVEKKPWFMGTTGPEEFVLNQMLASVKDPISKMTSDIKLAQLVKEAFYPEAEKPTEYDKKLDLFLQTEPTVDEVKKFVGGWIAPEKMSDFDKRLATFMLTEPTVPEMKKFLGGYITPETTGYDIKSIMANIPEGFELGSYNISSTGKPSFSFRRKGSTTGYEFETWDEAVAFRDTHPQEGWVAKIETEKGGYNVNWYKGTEGAQLTSSDIKSFNQMIYGPDPETPGIITPEDYEKVKGSIKATKKNFPMPEYLEIAEMNLSKCLNRDNTVLDMGLYEYFYRFYEKALEGKPPKYLPPKVIKEMKTGFFKNKISYGSALVDDYEMDFEAMKKDNVTEEDVWKELGGISP